MILWAFPDGNSTWASIMFILMNLIPMIMAYVFSKQCHEITGVSDFLKKVFIFKERPVAYLCALSAAVIYYGIFFYWQCEDDRGTFFITILGYLPWITAGSSNYFVFYLMILGNTFVFGTIKQLSRGTVPCILAHMVIDSLAVMLLVQSDIVKILILVFIEIVISM